jgi:hypothetical protein
MARDAGRDGRGMNDARFLTYSGKSLSLLRPQPAEIDVQDIAHHLSQMCRFNGATREFYSVAQHSVHVSIEAERIAPYQHAVEFAFFGLFHDASEAFLCDLSRPIKYTAQLAPYLEIEAVMQQAIFARFGLGPNMPQAIKEADDCLLGAEFRDLMKSAAPGWIERAGNHPKIRPLLPHAAEMLFLRRYLELIERRAA